MVRRLVHVVLIVVTLIVGATAAAIIVSQTAWFKDWLRGYIVREANQYLNGSLSIQRLGGNLFFGVEMENIGIRMDGQQVVSVKDLGIDYNVFELVTRGLSVDSIRVDRPVLYLRREGQTWSISQLVKKQQQEADRTGPARPIAIDEIGVSDGTLVIERPERPVGTSGVDVPDRIDRLDAQLSFKYEPVRYSIDISHVSFRASDPSLAVNALSGGISVHDDTVNVQQLALRTAESSVSVNGAVQQYTTKPNFALTVSSDKLSLPEIGRLVPSLRGIRLQPAFEVRLNGPLDRLAVDLNARSSAGAVLAKLTTDLAAPGQSVNGNITVRHLDLAPLLRNPKDRSDITADAHVDVRAASFSALKTLNGSVRVESPRIVAAGYETGRVNAGAEIAGGKVKLDARAAAYGASATASGTATLPSSRSAVSYDVRGDLRGLDLRKLPRRLNVPPAATELNAAYHVTGTGSAVSADATFARSIVAGAVVAPGSSAGATIGAGAPSYRADVTVANLDLQRAGREFRVAALDADRYKSDLNAHVTASGRGTAPKTMAVTASAELTNSTVLGGRIPNLSANVSLSGDTAHLAAKGAFAGFDPAVASGRPQLKGAVGGSLDVDATVAGVTSGVTADTVQGDARVTLQPSTVAGLAIDSAAVDASYHDRTGVVRTLDVKGRDLNVQASGTLALNEDGASNLKLHADSPDLAQVGKLAGQPLTGIGKVDAVITGNRAGLQVAGNLTADGASYGSYGALTLSSDYTVHVPELDASRAAVSATSHATFVKLGAVDINELTAKTDYANKQLAFDATASQPKRTLHAAGDLLLHPDHQEVHLQQFALTTAGLEWQIAPGTAPAIQYGGHAIDVKDLRLVSGAQQITADGTFGRPGAALKVTLAHVDLADVDALLLRPPQLSGRLNASSSIAGTTAAPHVTAEFGVQQGGFRSFKYDSLRGTVNYTGTGLTLDTRLQQNPTTWLTAGGYLPMALFRTPPPAAAGRPVDRIDFHVKSSPIDLGVVQGFTTAVTDVKGVLQANVDVTGTAADPAPSGDITVRNAAFKIAPTGVMYADLEADIALQPDRVRIAEFRLLDNDRSPLTVSGDLALRERKLGGVSLTVQADDFKVIDNEMGKVRVKSDLRLAGEVRQPRLEGTLGITTGEIDLDPILARLGTSAYATKPTEYATGEQPAANNGQTAPTGFAALAMDLHLTVPNDLVIKANDLKAPGAAFGLGAMNLTLGGDLHATKQPGRDVRLVGSVATVRGYYDFQGRRFTILRDGTVQFVGLREINPTLNIKAQRLIQGVQANVNVTGTMREPKIELSSVPPLDQADILSLIVFNQPLNQLGEGAQIALSRRVEQMATGAIANTLAESLGNALGLDQFEIQMAPETGEAAQLTVGEQVGQNLYVRVQQGVGQIETTNFILEYDLTSWLRLQTNLLEGASTQQSLFQRQQGSGIDLIFFFSY